MIFSSPNTQSIALILFTVLSALPQAFSAPNSQDAGQNTLLFVELADDPSGQTVTRQESLLLELQLGLPDYDVISIDAPSADFLNLSLTAQLEQLNEEIARYNALAASWLVRNADGDFKLQLVTMADGQSLLWSLNAGRASSDDPDAVLALRAVLTDFNHPVVEPIIINQNLSSATNVIVQTSQAVPIPAEPRPLGLVFTGQVGIDIIEDPFVPVGGGIGIDLYLGDGFVTTLMASGLTRPQVSNLDGHNRDVSISFLGALSYRWIIGPLHLGPKLAVQIPWSRTVFEINNGDQEVYSWWNLRISGGVDLSFELTPRFSLLVTPLLGVNTVRQEFERQSDGSTLFNTARWQLDILAGFVVRPF